MAKKVVKKEPVKQVEKVEIKGMNNYSIYSEYTRGKLGQPRKIGEFATQKDLHPGMVFNSKGVLFRIVNKEGDKLFVK